MDNDNQRVADALGYGKQVTPVVTPKEVAEATPEVKAVENKPITPEPEKKKNGK